MFDSLINTIIKIEGGYSDGGRDSGGKTKYGITEAVARRWGYTGEMKDMPKAIAKLIYFDFYWQPLNLQEISGIMSGVVQELLDTGINQGIGRAGEYLQLSLNALNRQGRDYEDLKIDGEIGPATLRALRAYRDKRGLEGAMVLNRCLNCLQGAYYIHLSQRRPKDEAFVYGWILNRVVIWRT